jgi:hypothetical protein
MPHKIIKCTCTCEYQDKVYGKSNRVHSVCQSGNNVSGFRCSVCSNKKDSSAAGKEK